MTAGSSMLLMMRISPLHFGQIRGSTSYIFCINRAQFRRRVLISTSGSRIQGIESLSPFFYDSRGKLKKESKAA